MLQELKQSHQQLQESNMSKEKEMKLAKDKQTEESKMLEKKLQREYQEGLKAFQQSYMEKFDQLAS